MNPDQLKALQAPLKTRYQENPREALVEFLAAGTVNFETLCCDVDVHHSRAAGTIRSGLHPAAGGDGSAACSGDMLLQSLVACSGVTLAAVSTAMNLQITSARIEARGTLNFCGTLGIDRSVPVGLTQIHLQFVIDAKEADEKISKLIDLTERYCVVLQTLKHSVVVTSSRG